MHPSVVLPGVLDVSALERNDLSSLDDGPHWLASVASAAEPLSRSYRARPAGRSARCSNERLGRLRLLDRGTHLWWARDAGERRFGHGATFRASVPMRAAHSSPLALLLPQRSCVREAGPGGRSKPSAPGADYDGLAVTADDLPPLLSRDAHGYRGLLSMGTAHVTGSVMSRRSVVDSRIGAARSNVATGASSMGEAFSVAGRQCCFCSGSLRGAWTAPTK